MTDGTSQGLFIVVAIVIFGIFVTLSYTVFGNDGLSGGIQGLFTTSVGQVEHQLNSNNNLLSHPNSLRVNYVSDYSFDGRNLYFTHQGENTNVNISIHYRNLLGDNSPYQFDKYYMVTGTMLLNGEAVTAEQWTTDTHNNLLAEGAKISFIVDDETGYFEGIYQHTNITRSESALSRILHNPMTHRDGSNLRWGDKFEVRNLTLLELDEEMIVE